MVIIKILIALVIFTVIYLFCLNTDSKRHSKLMHFEETYIAHRGLFDDELKAPENSMKAFERAVSYRFGIELDVRLTKDNELVVFHDDSLKRMCGIDKDVYDYTFAELKDIYLKDSKETIPKLFDVLKMIERNNLKIPLVIEIKAKKRPIETAKMLARVMKEYKGVYCIQSFNPSVLGWYRKNYPDILRGQLSSGYSKKMNKKWMFEGFLITYLIFNWYTKPDFISLNYRHSYQISYMICRKLYKVKNAGWTIRSQKELDKIKGDFDIIIFDGFIPKK